MVLTRFVSGSAAAMGGETNVNLNNKYLVLDTSGMPDDLILPGIFWATDLANDLIMDAGAALSALIADELWALVGANSNPLAAAYVQEMVKTIRGLGGIAITSTQGMQDLFGLEGGKYGKGILDSSRIKLIMQMEEQEARLIHGDRYFRFSGMPCLWSTSTAASTAAVSLIRTTKAGRLFPTRSRVGLSRMTTSTVSAWRCFPLTVRTMSATSR